MRKTLTYGFKALQLAWHANGMNAIVMLVSNLYESTIYPFIQILLLSMFLDLLTQLKTLTFTDIGWIVVFYLLASFLKLIFKSFLDVKEAFLQTQQDGYIDLQISKKLSELDPATFEKPEFQDLIAQLEGIKGTLQMHLVRFTGLIDAVFKFITAVIVVSVIFPSFAPLIIIATIPSYLAFERFRTKTWPYYVEKRSIVTRVTQYIKNLLSSDSTSKEAIIFQTGPVLLNKIKKEQQQYYKNFAKANDPWILNIILARILQFGVFAYTQYLNLFRVLQGALSIGQFTLIFQQTFTLALSAESILSFYSSIAARNKYLDKYFEFLNTKKIINSPLHSVALPNNQTPPIIEFKNVAFRYPTTERYILKDFNLTIQSGEKIALVGENGAGKTTLIKLLLRFYDVTEGEILISGVNIKDVDLGEWHKLIGALFQDFIKYQFTFKENVYFGDLTRNQEEKFLKDAIEKSGADKYVDTLPDKYNQVVGKMFEGGIDLSGGQWQKLALARTFFRNAPILVLDEPTSAIDAKAEYEIFEKVQKLQKDKTVIIISHRFSTVRNADRILVLNEGKIIEEGSHEKLMKKDGVYAELFNLQAKGYK